MTEEQLFDLQRHTATQDAHLSSLDSKFEMFMTSHEDFKEEMRRQNEMRAAEVREMQTRFYAKIDTLETKFENKIDGVGREVRNIFLTVAIGAAGVIAGIAAIAVAVWLK